MHLSNKGVQVRWEGGDESLPLTGLHLRDLAVVEREGAEDLHVERAHPNRSHRGFTSDGERLVADLFAWRSLGQPALELGGLGSELLVGHSLDLVLKIVDFTQVAIVALQLLGVGLPKDEIQSLPDLLNCHGLFSIGRSALTFKESSWREERSTPVPLPLSPASGSRSGCAASRTRSQSSSYPRRSSCSPARGSCR